MRFTSHLLLLAFLANPLLSFADTNKECLQHPGGAFADVECFNGLANDLIKENKILMAQIRASIPSTNKNYALLGKYERSQTQFREFCELSRASLLGWERPTETINPRYYTYDVAYYRCLHSQLTQQHVFLIDILNNRQLSK